jgi:hypothetical protein
MKILFTHATATVAIALQISVGLGYNDHTADLLRHCTVFTLGVRFDPRRQSLHELLDLFQMSSTRPTVVPITHRHVPQVIDLREPDRFDLWCRTLGATRHELARAVSSVGGNPDLVRCHLKQRRAGPGNLNSAIGGFSAQWGNDTPRCMEQNMTRRSRRNHSPEFKAKVALTHLR